MRTLPTLTLGLTLLASSVSSQHPEIIGFDIDGRLTFTSQSEGKTFSLEFSPTLAGPWTNWSAIINQPITGAVMQVPSPLFFRVVEGEPSALAPGLDRYLALLGWDDDGDSVISDGEAQSIRDLELNGLGTGFRELDLSSFIDVEMLSVDDFSRLENLTLPAATSLTSLVISGTGLSEIEVRDYPFLHSLIVADNFNLTTLEITNLPSLASLAILENGGPLDFVVCNFPKLAHVELSTPSAPTNFTRICELPSLIDLSAVGGFGSENSLTISNAPFLISLDISGSFALLELMNLALLDEFRFVSLRDVT